MYSMYSMFNTNFPLTLFSLKLDASSSPPLSSEVSLFVFVASISDRNNTFRMEIILQNISGVIIYPDYNSCCCYCHLWNWSSIMSRNMNCILEQARLIAREVDICFLSNRRTQHNHSFGNDALNGESQIKIKINA